MSRKGAPYDCSRDLFSCLKCECIDFLGFRTRKDATRAISSILRTTRTDKEGVLHGSPGVFVES